MQMITGSNEDERAGMCLEGLICVESGVMGRAGKASYISLSSGLFCPQVRQASAEKGKPREVASLHSTVRSYSTRDFTTDEWLDHSLRM